MFEVDDDFDKLFKRSFTTALVLAIGTALFWAAVITVGIIFAIHTWW